MPRLEPAAPTPSVVGLALVLCALADGCRSTPQGRAQLGASVERELARGRPTAAREFLAAPLRARPQDGRLHLLNGLTYQLEDDSRESLRLARVGYESAANFAPADYWSHYLAGSAALELSEPAAAGEHFASAILADPGRAPAFVGLAVASWDVGDLELGHLAAQRALALGAREPEALGAAAYLSAARGDHAGLESVLAQADGRLDGLLPKLEHLARFAERAPAQEREPDGASTLVPAAPSQVMVEVTLLLNQSQSASTTGINLLDGLRVQFGGDVQRTETSVTGQPDTVTKIFTTAIQVPQLTYSLNLFNTKNDTYRVVARPSLVAYLDQRSEFFIGRTVTVGVSGINIGTLQPIDVGTSVRVTPQVITTRLARFHIEVERSFFAAETGGTFDQSLTTFKQTVDAVAEVEFGRTLILSGLYEVVDVGASSKVPFLGDVPVLDTFFDARTRTNRRDVALVLVTPRLAASIDTGSREFRGEALQRLLQVWQELIDEEADLDAVLDGLAARRGQDLPQPLREVDLRLPPLRERATLTAIVSETVAALHGPL